MFNFLNKLFGSSSKETLKELFANGAVIIDVRTKTEFDGGHIKDSQNIPLDRIHNSIGDLNKSQTYIMVCASGIRSRNAMNILKEHGFEHVYNGGSWTRFL